MICERCRVRKPIPTEKYCKECKKEVLAELKEAGYLTPKPFLKPRSFDQMEDQRETRRGPDR